MKKMIFGLLAIGTLVLVSSCEPADTVEVDNLYEIDKGTPPPTDGIDKGTPPPTDG